MIDVIGLTVKPDDWSEEFWRWYLKTNQEQSETVAVKPDVVKSTMRPKRIPRQVRLNVSETTDTIDTYTGLDDIKVVIRQELGSDVYLGELDLEYENQFFND